MALIRAAKKSLCCWTLSAAGEFGAVWLDFAGAGMAVSLRICTRLNSILRVFAIRSCPIALCLYGVQGFCRGDYLLIFIVDDLGAHEFLAYPTREQKTLLTEFERIANDFYYFGKV
jgi:hypothetical protein